MPLFRTPVRTPVRPPPPPPRPAPRPPPRKPTKPGPPPRKPGAPPPPADNSGKWMAASMIIPGLLTTATSLTASILGAETADNLLQTMEDNPTIVYAIVGVAGVVLFSMLKK